MKKKNLILFEDKFGVGGIEKFIYNLCSRIDMNKYNVRLVVVNKITDYYDKSLSNLGVSVDVLLPTVESNPVKRFIKGLPAFKHYLNKNKNKCDLIHFNLSDSIDLLYVKIAKNCGIKNRIVHSHNSSATSIKKKWVHKLGKIFLANEPNYFIACSREAAKWLFPSKIYKTKNYLFLQNAIDVSKYTYNEKVRKKIRSKYNWENNVIYGEVARFNTQKNHRFLIEIFSKILTKQKNAKLVLVGDGELLPEIKNQVKEMSLEKKVVFLGVSGNVPDLLQAFDVFMLPSLYEGLPFVLVESQAASLPVIVSDTVTRDVNVTDYISYYSLGKSADDWAKIAIKLSKVARDNDQSSLYKSDFDISNMMKKLNDFYTTICSPE